MIWVLVCNNMCRYERHFRSFSRYQNPTILETVSIPTPMRILFIEIQWQGTILGPMCLCQGKMWKSKVKNIFSYHFPRWPVGVKPCHTVLKFPWLRNHLRLINNKNTATSSIRCCDQVFLQSMAFYEKYEQEWCQITQSHDLRPTKCWPISTVSSDLYRRFMSARLDDLCPYFCLNPMVVHRKTYVLMFCNT